jgi:hypothetical protein
VDFGKYLCGHEFRVRYLLPARMKITSHKSSLRRLLPFPALCSSNQSIPGLYRAFSLIQSILRGLCEGVEFHKCIPKGMDVARITRAPSPAKAPEHRGTSRVPEFPARRTRHQHRHCNGRHYTCRSHSQRKAHHSVQSTTEPSWLPLPLHVPFAFTALNFPVPPMVVHESLLWTAPSRLLPLPSHWK